MRRFPPIFLIFCLLLCTILAVLWVRSLFIFDVIARGYAGGSYYEYATLPGQFRVTAARPWPYDLPRIRASGSSAPPRLEAFGHQTLFQWSEVVGIKMHADFRKVAVPPWANGGRPTAGPATVYYRTLAIPFATPLFLAAIYPAWYAFAARRRRRRETRLKTRGLCPGCGYDLRGGQSTCPECGRAVEDVTKPP
jgi:hypothetical protein